MPKDRENKGHVLVVEDDEDNLELIGRILRSDVHLWVARDTTAARRILTENSVDLIIADHRLPGETGVSLLRSIAQTRPGLGRFLVTAYGDSDDVVAACQEGIVERFFLKPYAPVRLKGAVLERLRRLGLAKPRALLVDDSENIRAMVKEVLAKHSVETTEAASGRDAMARLDEAKFDVVILDLSLPDIDGAQVLAHAQQRDPHLPVLILTAQEYSVGINFLEAGAFDFLGKPFKLDELIMRTERAILAHRQAVEHQNLLDETKAIEPELTIVAESPGMKAVMDQAAMVAGHDVNVLISGETGTGKEVVARSVHRLSRRAKGPFIAVNCGSLTETLADSELFGHEKWAFTDAKNAKPGIFRTANGGTVFLDEIGELSAQSQVRLLRVLESHEVTAVGATKPVPVDVRVIVATHRDLEAMIAENRFRRDLYYRLNAFRIDIPPLRDRKPDIAPLVELAVARFCAHNQLAMTEITAGALAQACSYAWPGNIRELFHVVERALITHGTSRLDTLDLTADVVAVPATGLTVDSNLPMRAAIDPVISQLEKQYLKEVIERCEGQLGRAAAHAGIHRKSLYNKLKLYGLAKN